jgi:hypothetical protein
MPVNFLDLPEPIEPDIKPPSPVVWAVLLVVAIAIGIALTLTLWPNDRSSQCWQFHTWMIGVPSICWCVLLAGRNQDVPGEILNLLKGDGSPLKLTTAGDGRASQLQIAFDHFKAQMPKLLEGTDE